ncbi:MAG: phenylacetate--CoA ligase family protein [Alphaproteobacteria bacterium]
MRTKLKLLSWLIDAATLPAAGRTAPLPGDDPAQYEAQRKRQIAYMRRQLPHYLRRLTWSREQVLAEQTRALREMLRHAKENSPWYARRLKGIDVDRIDGATVDLLPVMTKREFMENWDEIVTDRSLDFESASQRLAANTDDFYIGNGHHVVASGGSSGYPGLFAFDWHGWSAMALGPLRGLLALSLHLKMSPLGTGAVIYADRAGHSSYSLARTFSSRSQRIAQFPVMLPPEEIVSGVNDVKPMLISCYSSYLPVLTEARREGRLKASPKLIWTSAEPLSDADRLKAEEAFGCTVVNTWGATESMGSMPAMGQPGMYMSDDMNVFEYIDEQGRAIGPGETSNGILITNLYSKLMPIIRYELSDQFVLSEEPAAYGMPFTHVDRVRGRADDVFRYGGIPVHPVVFWTYLDRMDGLIEFQIRQLPKGADILVVTSKPVDWTGVIGELTGALRHLGIPDPEVRIREVESIERQAIGKLKRFVPLERDEAAAS